MERSIITHRTPVQSTSSKQTEDLIFKDLRLTHITMFSKLFTLSVLAAATASALPQTDQQCSTGSVQCCESVQNATDPGVADLLGVLGIVLQDIDALVGLTCSPISVVGVGNSNCESNTVCCEDNAIGGLLSIGCLPLTL